VNLPFDVLKGSPDYIDFPQKYHNPKISYDLLLLNHDSKMSRCQSNSSHIPSPPQHSLKVPHPSVPPLQNPTHQPYQAESARSRMEFQCNLLINWLQPTKQSQSRRMDIYSFVKDCLEKHHCDLRCELVGSTPLRSYLADDVLEIMVVDGNGVEGETEGNTNALLKINEALCRQSLLGGRGQKIHKVQLAADEVKCLVNNVGVNIRVNNFSDYGKMLFVQEANEIIGQDNLLKRSLLLTKSWCINEAMKYTPGNNPIMGVLIEEGGLNDFVIAVMLLMMLNFEATQEQEQEHEEEKSFFESLTPLKILFKWMSFFSSCDWEGLTLKAIINENTEGLNGHLIRVQKLIVESIGRFCDKASVARVVGVAEGLGVCKLQDPVRPMVNLTKKVSNETLHYVSVALNEGARHMDNLEVSERSTAQHSAAQRVMKKKI